MLPFNLSLRPEVSLHTTFAASIFTAPFQVKRKGKQQGSYHHPFATAHMSLRYNRSKSEKRPVRGKKFVTRTTQQSKQKKKNLAMSSAQARMFWKVIVGQYKPLCFYGGALARERQATCQYAVRMVRGLSPKAFLIMCTVLLKATV